MSLTVETGAVVANADSFITLAYAQAYWASIGRDSSAYHETDDIEPAIRRATQLLSEAYDWMGLRVQGRDQPLSWPRTGVYDREGHSIDSNEIPIELQKATAEIAWRELTDAFSMSPDFIASGAVRREKIGQIEVEYVNGARSADDQRPVIMLVRDLISPFLLVGAGSSSLAGEAYRI